MRKRSWVWAAAGCVGLWLGAAHAAEKYSLGTPTGQGKGIVREHGTAENDYLGWSSTSQWCRMYDPAKVGTFEGAVEGTSRVSPYKGMSPGIHFKLKTATESISVHLGPEYYLDAQPVKIVDGDKVTVKGSRVQYLGGEIIIADTVQKGDQTLTLRVGDHPAWIGGGVQGGGPHEMPAGSKVGPTKDVP